MKAIENYKSYKSNDDIMDQHIENMSRLINQMGMNGLSAIDRYIIACKETKDGRRALLDIEAIPMVEKAIKEGVEANIEKIIQFIAESN